LLLATSAFGAWRMSAYRAAEAAPLSRAAGFMAAHSPSAVYADGEWANSAGYYLRGLHKEPYYLGTGHGKGFLRPFGKVETAVKLPRACAVAAASATLPQRLVVLKPDILEMPGQAVVYCFK
jgi:hypothetical protein